MDEPLCEELDPETLRFLFEKRLELFNVRRDHEWKIIFGIMAALGAIDFAIITGKISFSDMADIGWHILLGVIFISCFVYEAGIQFRNRIDRIVMDELNTKLCDCQNIVADSPIRIPIDVAGLDDKLSKNKKIYSYTFLWAFIIQITVLLVVVIISSYLPHLIQDSDILLDKK